MDRVLIVDDSATQVEWTAAILREGGFEAEVAATAEQALGVLSEERFDLVVSDIIMPEMSGYELCRRIKATRSETKPPVILLSALNQPMDIIRGLECGADNFLSKPCPADLLVTRAHSLLRTKALRAERNSGVGVEVEFLGQKFDVTSSKEQILDLLVSTFEDTVRVNRELENGRAALAVAKSTLEIRNEELKSLNRTLAEAETWYHSILDCAPEAMLVITQDGRIASANTRAEELFGYAQGLEDLAIGNLIISEEDRSLYVRADGWNLPAEVSVSALPAVSGRTGYSCVTVRDISESSPNVGSDLMRRGGGTGAVFPSLFLRHGSAVRAWYLQEAEHPRAIGLPRCSQSDQRFAACLSESLTHCKAQRDVATQAHGRRWSFR